MTRSGVRKSQEPCAVPVSVTTGQHPDTQTPRHTDTWTHGHTDTETQRHSHRHRQRCTCVGWSTNRDNEIAKIIINYFRRRISHQLAKINSKWNNISLVFSPQWYHSERQCTACPLPLTPTSRNASARPARIMIPYFQAERSHTVWFQSLFPPSPKKKVKKVDSWQNSWLHTSRDLVCCVDEGRRRMSQIVKRGQLHGFEQELCDRTHTNKKKCAPGVSQRCRDTETEWCLSCRTSCLAEILKD